MSDKEATVFIIDLGRSMQEKHGRSETDLDFSLKYLYDKISNIVSTGRKTLLVGVLGFRTDGTKNDMSDEEGYENISVIQPIQQTSLAGIRNLAKHMKPSGTNAGDGMSAIILGVDMIMKHCRHLKYIKRLYLLTNGTGAMDAEEAELESTAKQILDKEIQLTVLGVDFDDAEYGYKQEDKPFGKADNEKALKRLVELTNGTYATMSEAVENLDTPEIKKTRPMPSYKGVLSLGGQEDTAILIDIERYPKVMIRKPPSASQFVLRDVAPSQMDVDQEDDLAAVKAAYSYQVPDENSATGFRDVPFEDLAKGYQYGRTAVPISVTDQNITAFPSDQSYEIIGFVPTDSVERYMFMSTTSMIVPSLINDKAAFALSSLVHGLFNQSSYAMARVVRKDGSEPMLVMLSPHIDGDFECLIENDLPFSEDLRAYRFPPLDKVHTVGGSVKKDHIKLPSDKLMKAMSDYVDQMSLIDEDGSERFGVEDVYSPLYHSIESAIKVRAVDPDAELPEKPRIVMEPSRIPEDIKERSKPALTRLIEVADVKKVPARVKGRARWRQKESEKPLSNLDIDALLKPTVKPNGTTGTKKSIRIDPLNAVPEFKRLMQTVADDDLLKSSLDQMAKIAEDLVTSSYGNLNYDRAIEILGVVREELIDLEMPELYNAMLKQIKQKVIDEELGGDRWDFWHAIKMKRKLGFISNEESDTSNMSKEEAQKLMSLKS